MAINNNIELKGSNIYLKTLNSSNLEEKCISWLNDPEINKFLEVRHNIPTFEEQKKHIDTYDNHSSFYFGVYTNDTNLLIGTISLSRNIPHQTATYGYLIGERDFWGTSAGIDACCLLMDFAFNDLDIRKVIGNVYQANIGSIFNFKKLGFEKEGCLKEALIFNEKPTDCYYFGLMKDAWDSRRQKLNY